MGFEALMRGCSVRCFGMPFYAGWGLTTDDVPCARRVRSRTLLDVFHAADIVHSRYDSPILVRACDLEEVLDYFATQKKPARDDAAPHEELEAATDS
jgi:capsular polysaccharide export protein